jgi:hypothetical protein
MAKDLYTLDEFVIRANRELCKQDTCKQDNRMQKKITARRVRDYSSKDIIDKPFKQGRNAFYNNEHLQQLINARQLQQMGFTDHALTELKPQHQDLKHDHNVKDVLESTDLDTKQTFRMHAYEEYMLEEAGGIALKVNGLKRGAIDSLDIAQRVYKLLEKRNRHFQQNDK